MAEGVRIIAIPRDEDDVIGEERGRLSDWAPANGWAYVEYADVFELLSRIADLRVDDSSHVTEIEIVAHGNPAICDDVSIDNAAVVAQSLQRIRGVGDRTAVYLSGCNTGLELNGDCVASSFADVFRGSVFGSRGYLRGTHAERNEACVASFELDGVVYHPYSRGTDAVGDAVWNRFGSPARSGGGERMQIKIATSGFRAVNLTDAQGQDLVAAVEEVVRTPAAQSARMRMAPDLRFALQLADGERVFELLAGGTVLRDPVTREVWQFERGREILRTLSPYRKLPAA